MQARFSGLAEAQAEARRQPWWHIGVECTAVVDDILDTLSAEGPYAYTAMPEQAEGVLIPNQRVVSTREDIRACYEQMHEAMELRQWRATTEIVGDWYAFHHGLATVELKETGESMLSQSCVLFPTMGGKGITGELFWARASFDPVTPDVDDGTALSSRLTILARHDRYLDCLRSGDVDGIVGGVAERAQTAIRDYVDDTGTLTQLHDRQDLRNHLERFYDRYEVADVEVLSRHVDDWFVFAELQLTLRGRAGDLRGRTVRARTADYAEVGPDALVIARIGHGTDLRDE